MNKEIIIKIHIFVYYLLSIIIYFLIKSLCEGTLIQLYSNNKFNDTKYFDLWNKTTSYQRFIFSDSYYTFLNTLKSLLEELKNNKKNPNINITITNYINESYITNTKIVKNLENIIVTLTPINNTYKEKNKLLICSHFDGHNLTKGGTAYDDQIHVISMLGTIDAIINNNETINTQIDFLFDGFEENGLDGARNFIYSIKNKTNIKYDYLNLESMGSSTPYLFTLKSKNGSKNIQNALSNSKGTIFLPLNFLFNTKITTSTSNHIVFDENGFKGGLNVFLGLGSHYHTKYDNIKNKEHLFIAGHQLLDFVLNFNPYDNDNDNNNVYSFGICPFCFIISSTFCILIIIFFFISTYAYIYLYEGKNIKKCLFEILKFVIMFILVLLFFILESFISYLFNTCSFASNQFFLILISFSGLCIFYLMQIIFNITKWDLIRLFFDSLIMLLLITTDVAFPFIFITVCSFLFYIFKKKYLQYIFSLIRTIIISLYYSNLIQIIMQYTTRIKGYLADLLLYLTFFIFSFHCSIPGIAIAYNENDSIYNINIEEMEPILNNFNEFQSDFENDDLIERKKEQNNFYSYLYKSIFIIFPIIIIFIIIFKPYPYSINYTLKGEFIEIFEENKTGAQFLFYPYKGIDYLKKYSKNNRNIKYENYTYNSINKKGNVFLLDASDEKVPCSFEDTKIENISENHMEIHLKFSNINSSCINSIFIFINCSNCVKEGNGIKYISKKDENHYMMRLYVGKNKNDSVNDLREIETKIKVNTTNYTMDIIYNSKITSPKFLEFLNSFGESTVNYQYSKVINDVLYIIHYLKKE